MKLTNMLCVGSLVFVLGACSTPASDSTPTPTTTATSTPEAEVKEVVTSGKYEVTNNTGADIDGLYIYDATSSDKGTNYAEGGLADGETITVEINVDEDKAEGYAMKVEYVAGDTTVTVFENLHLEEAPLYLKSEADVTSGATPFTKPE